MRLALALAMSLALAGCEEAPAPETVVGPAADRPLTSVGISVASLRDPYFTAIAHGAEAEARRVNPTVSLTSESADYSASTQIEQIGADIDRHVDLILLTPTEPDRLADVVGRARKAGIVVVALDTPLASADAQVVNDAAAAGALACQTLADRLGGHGIVAVLAAPALAARLQGCSAALAPTPDIHVITPEADPDSDGMRDDGTRDDGKRAMRSLSAANPQIDGVVALAEPLAFGAADMAQELGRTPQIVAIGGSPAMQAALANPARATLVAAVALDPSRIGRNGVRVGQDLRQRRPSPPDQMTLAPSLVTRETVADYKGWLADQP